MLSCLTIENALKVFLEEGFSGNAKGSEIEARLHGKLKEREVLEFDGEVSDWNGLSGQPHFTNLVLSAMNAIM